MCERFFVYFLSACVLMCTCISQLCLVCVNSLITHLQLKIMSVLHEFAHVAITFQLLERSSITIPNEKQF